MVGVRGYCICVLLWPPLFVFLVIALVGVGGGVAIGLTVSTLSLSDPYTEGSLDSL